jgi:hypothetical protein
MFRIEIKNYCYMRIAQIINSLDAGGAERMAGNYANALLKNSVFRFSY